MALREEEPTMNYAPNLAPMVDVVMVILTFFMLGMSVSVVEGVLPTELPSQVGPGGSSTVAIVPLVRIVLLESEEPPGCQIVVYGRELPENSFAALEGFLRERRTSGANETARILIDAGPGVAYQNVISAMDSCIRAGFGNIQFSVHSRLIDAAG